MNIIEWNLNAFSFSVFEQVGNIFLKYFFFVSGIKKEGIECINVQNQLEHQGIAWLTSKIGVLNTEGCFCILGILNLGSRNSGLQFLDYSYPKIDTKNMMLLLLLSRFSRVQLCATP